MKKYSLYALAAFAISLTACQSTETVKIAYQSNVVDNTLAPNQSMPIEKPHNKDVTAICLDGSQSIEKGQSACLGHGGVKFVVKHYSE